MVKNWFSGQILAIAPCQTSAADLLMLAGAPGEWACFEIKLYVKVHLERRLASTQNGEFLGGSKQDGPNRIMKCLGLLTD